MASGRHDAADRCATGRVRHAHYLWYAYALVGAVALLALVAFKAATDRRDARRWTEGSRDPGIEESRDQGIKATAEPR